MRHRVMVVGSIGMMVFAVMGLLCSSAGRAAEKEFVWANIDDFSGPYAASTEESFRSMTMFLEERGYKIGPFKVKVVTRDTELKPATAVRRLQEVIAEYNPLIVTSGEGSSVHLAMADVIKKAKGPIFWADGWDTSFTGLNGNRYSFRWDTPISNQFEAVLNGLFKLFPDIKKGMNLQVDSSGGYDAAKTIERVLNERGVQLLKNQFIPSTATDISVFANEAKASGADVYIVGLYGKIFGTALMQCKEFGLSKTMKILSATGSIFTFRGVGSDVIQGMYFGEMWDHTMPNEWSRSFTEKYKKKWNVIPGAKAAGRYAECQLMERVITQTGSTDPKVLIPALENLGEFDGPTGKEYIAPWQHQVIHDFLVLRAKAPSEKKYEDDYVNIIGTYRVSPKQGDKGFEFDRTKDPL